MIDLDRGRGRHRYLGAVVGVLLAALLGVREAPGTETRWWLADTAEQLLEGRGEGVAVTDDGRLVPARRWLERAELEEPVVLAGATADDGSLLVATGHPARLYRVKGTSATLLAELPGEQATAVLPRPDGSVLVATVSPGLLLEVRGDRVEEVGRLGEGGFWDLLEVGGQVVAAAGPPASLYRLGRHGLERWVELPDAHARCLAPSGDGVVVGTSGKGLILRVGPDGAVGLLADSPFNEIADLLAAPDGTVWAVALVGEPPPSPPGTGSDKGSGGSDTSSLQLDLPKVDGGTATSELLRLTSEGALVKVHRFPKQVAGAMAWDGTGVLVGTGFEGELWRFVDRGGARLATVDATQVTAILGGGAAVLTQGPGGVLWGEERGEGGRFRSDTKRFPRPVRFGRYRVDPAPEGARIRFRSGLSETPDPTWLPWSDWLGPAGAVPLPPGSSLQWELELSAGGNGVERVEVAYREVNLAPRVESVEVEEPGVIYLPGPPPSGPVVDVTHPDRSGIFSVLDDKPSEERKPKQGKQYWRVGFRTVSWKGEDPNGDPLRFTVELERDDGFRLPVRQRLETTELAVDTTAVPDGLYRFRVGVSDEEANPGAGQEAVGVSPWFDVDSTPPEVRLERGEGEWRVTVSDRGSSVAQVEWSRDGEVWRALAPSDGLLDGREERFALPVAPGRHLLVVRAVDRHHNRTTVGAVEGEE